MAVRETVDIDLQKVDELIAREEAVLEPKHRASIEYKRIAAETVTGGVASSWQDAPPHVIFADHAKGSRLWDIDGNEYIDFHLGYGAMVAGHAHPKIVAAIRLRKEIDNEWLLILSGIVSVLFGIGVLIVPGAGALALVWVIGLYAIIEGVLYIGLAFRLKKHVHA